MIDGTRQAIDYMFVIPNISGLKQAIDEYGGLVIGYRLHDRDRLENRIVDGILSRRPLDCHAMVISNYDNRYFTFVNSWGSNWNQTGKVLVPYVLTSQDFLKESYYITIL
jgi:uncharacterized protein YvpB